MSEIKPWLDRQGMLDALPIVENTLDAWVAQGIIPPPRKRGGKLLWKWSEVDEWLTVGKAGKSPGDDKAEAIRNATRAEATASSGY